MQLLVSKPRLCPRVTVNFFMRRLTVRFDGLPTLLLAPLFTYRGLYFSVPSSLHLKE
jgi:hypothetical protein